MIQFIIISITLIVILLILILLIGFIGWEAKNTLLTDQNSWSAKEINISRTKKKANNKLNQLKGNNGLLEIIAEESDEYLKEQDKDYRS